MSQLLRESPDLFLEYLNLTSLRVIVLNWLVADVAGLTRISHRAEVLINLSVTRVQAGYHEAVGVASETLPQQTSQLRVSVRHVGLT